MFAAHEETVLKDNGGRFVRTYYTADAPGTMLGCTEQYQFCLGTNTNDSCTSLGGRIFDANEINFPGATEKQLAIISLLSIAATFSTVMPRRYKVEDEMSTLGGFVNDLPNDQWVREVQGWTSVAWAAHQIIIAEYAIGPSVRERNAKQVTRAPANQGEKDLCGMQKMRKPGGFVNINLFGLVFIICVSCTVTIIDLLLLRFIVLLKNKDKLKSPRFDRWIQEGVFQLLRKGHEANGEAVWTNLNAEVPITVEKTKLPDLPLQFSPISPISVEDKEETKFFDSFQLRPAVPTTPHTKSTTLSAIDCDIDSKVARD